MSDVSDEAKRLAEEIQVLMNRLEILREKYNDEIQRVRTTLTQSIIPSYAISHKPSRNPML